MKIKENFIAVQLQQKWEIIYLTLKKLSIKFTKLTLLFNLIKFNAKIKYHYLPMFTNHISFRIPHRASIIIFIIFNFRQ